MERAVLFAGPRQAEVAERPGDLLPPGHRRVSTHCSGAAAGTGPAACRGTTPCRTRTRDAGAVPSREGTAGIRCPAAGRDPSEAGEVVGIPPGLDATWGRTLGARGGTVARRMRECADGSGADGAAEISGASSAPHEAPGPVVGERGGPRALTPASYGRFSRRLPHSHVPHSHAPQPHAPQPGAGHLDRPVWLGALNAIGRGCHLAGCHLVGGHLAGCHLVGGHLVGCRPSCDPAAAVRSVPAFLRRNGARP